MFKYIFVFLSLSTIHAYASPMEACTQILEAKKGIHMPGKFSLIRDLLLLKFAPGKMVKLRDQRADVADSLLVHQEDQTQSSSEGRNVIFSIDPPKDVLATIDLNQKRLQLDEIVQEMNSLNPMLIQISQSESIDDCLEKVKILKFDFDHYLHLFEEKMKLQIVNQVDEGAMANQVIRRTIPHLQLKWEVIHSTDLMVLHEVLRNRDVQNVVIISHGKSDGKLVDSRLSEYPLGFFTDLSPSIRSITIFSCYAEEVSKKYQINEQLSLSPSRFKSRHLYYSKGKKIAGMEESVPVKAFRSFMQKVDQRLFNEMFFGVQENNGEVETNPLLCSLVFDGLKVIQGTLGFQLNGRFIGSLNLGNQTQSFAYPCDFLDREKNILIIRNLSLNQNSKIESLNFNLLPMVSGKKVFNESLHHFLRMDQSYQSSKYEFSLAALF